MAKISRQNELRMHTQSGKEMCTKIIDLVHIKLGVKAFDEIVTCRMDELDVFFYKYLKFSVDPDEDFIAVLTRIHGILESLPNHPDIQVFYQ